ncbi:MAG: threonine/serine exporter family protein, partial [Clostridiales Family XIII bacterium]|nr:threonine/serine exporter family protein [Clostridiales Family XIII bacterium]
MVNTLQKKILILALYAGELMLKSGAEVYRVEDTIIRICKACGIDFVECLATTTSITLSLDRGGGDSDMHTFIKRIDGISTDLERVSMINDFSREFTTTDMSVDDGLDRLRKISAARVFSLPLRVLGAALVGAFMCPYYGGGIPEMAISAGAACVGYLIFVGVSRFKVAGFILVFISCLGCAMVVLSFSDFYPWHNMTAMIISSVTIFMPGVAITNAARDLLSGDMLAGVARAADAAITAIAISVGAGVIAGIWIWNGGAFSEQRTDFPLALFPAFGFLMTIGFCLQMNAPRRQMVIASLIGAVGMFVLVGGPRIGQGALLTCFIGTCVIATLAEVASRAGRDATTVFIIPGIIPFVPGLGLFESASAILSNNITSGIEKGASAIITAGSIALALIVVATVARLIMELARRFENGAG